MHHNVVDERATRYPTVTDFFRSFNAEMHRLYLLSFLLTADHDKAEQCLVSAMGGMRGKERRFDGLDAGSDFKARDPK